MKTVSVLIAAFQAESWLQDCLDSVLKQSLPTAWQMEVLLGVDGCRKTLEAARSYNDPRIRILYLSHNRGTYITFNTLMQHATGDLICRFDADDVMLEGFLSQQIPILESGKDITMTWSIYTDAELKPTSHVLAHEVYHPKNGLNRRGTEGQFIIWRYVWEALGGFRAWRCGADTEFFIRLGHAGFRHTVVEDFLYLRRTHHQSLTTDSRTNFQSPRRLRIQALTQAYETHYGEGSKSTAVKARCEPEVSFINAATKDHPPPGTLKKNYRPGTLQARKE
ncbi:MAG: glycosyltransferase family 2 protein [Endozoicomonas sp.]